jgi:hypothetical protein
MQTPTAASDVFAIDTGTGDHNASFPIDFTLTRRRVDGASNYVMTRLLGDSYLRTNATDAEGSFNFDNLFDDMTGVDFTGGSGWYETSDTIGWMWKRARGYFDVVAYTGTGSATTVAHNLGVEPEIVIVKQRSSGNEFFWYVKSLGNTKKLELPGTAAAADAAVGGNQLWNSTTPTSSVFSVSDNARVNDSGETYVAYLFATVANVSKVGSFTQSGATNVACGFTGDTPALIIFKRTDASGNWYLFDSARGIVAGNDKSLYLNTTDAEITNADIVDPYSGGFATTSSLTNGDYIFYAIASIA